MDRRTFLKTSVPAIATLSLGLAGCGDDETPAPAPPPGPGAPPLPQPKFLTRASNFTDYRPSVDATGTKVLFERTPFPNPNGANTVLYLATGIDTASPVVTEFLKVPANPPAQFPFSQTRPDWSWATGEVAFSGAPSETSTIEAHLVAATGVTPRVVPNTRAHIYPIWTSDGTRLVIYDNSNSAAPAPPVSALIMPDGTVVVANLNGNNANGVQVFGGFAAPMPGNPTKIAFAGQPALANWGRATGASPVYNQDNNYVFLNTFAAGGYASAPLEPAASVATFNPAYQGRAPYWSPDGRYVVFESSRLGGYALFLADVAKVAAGAAPLQLTDPAYQAQHAKFLPGGKSIVYTALQNPGAAGPRGIAVIDIAAFL